MSDNQNNISDKWLLSSIIVAIITVSGSIIVALINQSAATLPIYTAQTAEARLTDIAMLTQAYVIQPVDTLLPPSNSTSIEISTVSEAEATAIEYTAVSGDTLSGISRQYLTNGYYADAIGRANCIDVLKVDDKVVIKYYIVQSGDTLIRIAEKFESSVESIQSVNNFSQEKIYSDQILILPVFEKCE